MIARELFDRGLVHGGLVESGAQPAEPLPRSNLYRRPTLRGSAAPMRRRRIPCTDSAVSVP